MEQKSYPVAIKLPGGPMISDGSRVTKDFGRLNRYEVAQTGEKIAIIGLGTFFELSQRRLRSFLRRSRNQCNCNQSVLHHRIG
ncbi:MAG: hypothetical protein ACLTLY_07610 [Agathobacter rectalis]